MKPTTNNVDLLFAFSLCLSFLPLLDAAAKNNLIAEACQKARYKDLCISSLEAEHESQDADLPGLALIAIKVATDNGSNTSVYVKKTLDTANLEPTVKQNFQDCSENYLSSTQQLDDSLAAPVSKNYKNAKVWLEAAITDATTCQTGLKQSPGNELELFSKNNIFLQLCSNALDIVSLLATK